MPHQVDQRWRTGRRPRARDPWSEADIRSVRANGLQIAYLEQGDGPLALCLHGFPDSPYTWRHLLPRLAAAGYRAVAPFSRGYAPTAVPDDGAYQLGALIADVEALHDALDGNRDAVLIGHDWGATVAYGAAAHAPQRWRRVVGLAVPPSGLLPADFLKYEQLKQAFYLFVSQTPLAELAFAADDYALIDGLWRDWAPGYDTRADSLYAKWCMRVPQNLTAVIGYQRAAFNPRANLPRYREQEAAATRTPERPVCYLHGRDDVRLAVGSMADVSDRLGRQGRVEVLDGCGHFLHLERPDEVNRLILQWLAQSQPDA